MIYYGEMLKHQMKLLYYSAVEDPIERNAIRKQMIELKIKYQIWQRSLLASIFLFSIFFILLIPILFLMFWTGERRSLSGWQIFENGSILMIFILAAVFPIIHIIKLTMKLYGVRKEEVSKLNNFNPGESRILDILWTGWAGAKSSSIVTDNDFPIASINSGENRFSVLGKGFTASNGIDKFGLYSGDERLARIVKIPLSWRLEIFFSERKLDCKMGRFWKPRFDIYENGEKIGKVEKKNLFSNKMIADLPTDIELPVRLFIVWVITIRLSQTAEK